MILDAIVAAKRTAHAARTDVDGACAPASPSPGRPFAAALRRPTPHGLPQVIAEFKRRSPSAGAIFAAAQASEVARAYAEAGAAALSVLTDAEFFGGSMADLGQARQACALPVLRKDFLLFDEDLHDARRADADAALLIVRLLDRKRLDALLALGRTLGLELLCEVHNEAECDTALAAGATLIGVNHRDLDTLSIDLGLSLRLATRFPPSVTRVAESGLKTTDDLKEMHQRGYHAVLVGEALMRTHTPGAALARLRGAP